MFTDLPKNPERTYDRVYLERLVHHAWNDPAGTTPEDWLPRYVHAKEREHRLGLRGRLRHAFGGEYGHGLPLPPRPDEGTASMRDDLDDVRS
jgi:hypothetical protein